MRRPLTLPMATAAAGLVLLAACGGEDSSTTAEQGGGDTRTVQIDMVDIAFEPDTIEVADGETVRFVFTNTGEAAHDAYLGDAAAQADHEAEMRDDSGMDHGMGHEGDRDAITVEPGDTGELTHTFDEPGTLEIGCHQEGHYAAGMKITVEVA